MNSRISVLPVKRKSDLKKVMSAMETAGSAVVINPMQANNAELAVETYFFNESLSSSVYPDSVPLIKIQRIGESVMIVAGGKINKSVVENIAVAYFSSVTNKNFFIPVEIPFDHFYSNKSVYLYHNKMVFDLTTVNNKAVTDAQMTNNHIFLITEDKLVVVGNLNCTTWRTLPISKANTLTVNDQNEIYIATDEGIFYSEDHLNEKYDKLEIGENSSINDIGIIGDIMVLSEGKNIVKAAVKENNKWQVTAHYNSPENGKLLLIGYSDFFGGLAMVTSDNRDYVDTMKFLTLPTLKELKHPRHVQS